MHIFWDILHVHEKTKYWMFVLPLLDSYGEILAPTMMVLRGKDLGSD